MKLHHCILLLLQAACSFCLTLPTDLQNPLLLPASPANIPIPSIDDNGAKAASAKRIAIIGTGITGSVAAFTLAEAGRLQPGGRPQITVFERNPIIGGRITTTQVFGDPRLTIDTCAATFSQLDDFCLGMTATNVGLIPTPLQQNFAGVGIWDGQAFRGFIEDGGFRDPQTWNLARKLRWYRRYGDAPWQFDRTVTSVRTKFRALGQTSFASLKDEVVKMGLEGIVRESVCENQLLNCTDDKSRSFAREVVEAGIRERFFGDYDQLNGLDAVLALGTENVVSVSGGNLRLVDRLIKLSGSTLQLGTNVTRISLLPKGGWAVNFAQGGTNGRATFDAVIIAAPLELSNITFEPPLALRTGTNLTYMDTVVTHFTTPNRLNASFFNISDPAPQNILTTGVIGKTDPPFFSLTLIGPVTRPETAEIENLYKLVSEGVISDSELGEYVEQNQSPTEPALTWIDRQLLPQSVPILAGNQTIQDRIEIAPGLFYAGGGEQITATVEFGCRMGSNAARLAYVAALSG